MNPERTFTLSKFQTACGCVDILMHSMERYFTSAATMEITDGISESIIRTVLHNAKILMNKPNDYKARAEIMWASCLSHNDLTGCGGSADWACHNLEHEISGMFNVIHGAGLSAIWGCWARYVYQENAYRFMQFAVNVLRIPCALSQPKQAALEGIQALEAFFRSLDMPISLKELNIYLNQKQKEELAYKCSFQNKRTIGDFYKLTMDDMERYMN